MCYALPLKKMGGFASLKTLCSCGETTPSLDREISTERRLRTRIEGSPSSLSHLSSVTPATSLDRDRRTPRIDILAEALGTHQTRDGSPIVLLAPTLVDTTSGQVAIDQRALRQIVASYNYTHAHTHTHSRKQKHTDSSGVRADTSWRKSDSRPSAKVSALIESHSKTGGDDSETIRLMELSAALRLDSECYERKDDSECMHCPRSKVRMKSRQSVDNSLDFVATQSQLAPLRERTAKRVAAAKELPVAARKTPAAISLPLPKADVHQKSIDEALTALLTPTTADSSTDDFSSASDFEVEVIARVLEERSQRYSRRLSKTMSEAGVGCHSGFLPTTDGRMREPMRGKLHTRRRGSVQSETERYKQSDDSGDAYMSLLLKRARSVGDF